MSREVGSDDPTGGPFQPDPFHDSVAVGCLGNMPVIHCLRISVYTVFVILVAFYRHQIPVMRLDDSTENTLRRCTFSQQGSLANRVLARQAQIPAISFPVFPCI